ncbi:hypothetical protein L6Q21_02580 [Sandaracinobacter sp. RS1-74]|nr:hypothetical protein [Sandaracinobacteroides sayramensis]
MFIGAILAAASAAAPAAAQPAPAPASARTLPPSTPIKLNSLEEVSSKTVEVGTKVRFAVAEDVVEGGVVVIPRGAPATGTVSWKTGRAIGGKSGKFEVTFDEVTVNGRSLRLMGKHRQEGKGNTLGAVLGSVVISGRSAVMLPGQTVQALTGEAVPF